MIKRIFILLGLIATSVYLVLAITVFNAKPLERTCKGMELEIMDDTDYGFITIRDIENSLKREKLLPIDVKQKDINIRKMEVLLEKNPFNQRRRMLYYCSRKGKNSLYQRILS